MKENEKELRQMISSLEDELKASMERENKLEEELKSPKKVSWIRSRINDPGSKVGKVIRLPRTVYRIVRYPEVRRELRGDPPLAVKDDKKDNDTGAEQEALSFAPLAFFYSEDDTPRINLVVRKISENVLRSAIEFSNSGDYELRVVTYGEKAGVMKYREMEKIKGFPKAKNICFYSSVDQAKRKNPFELEIGKNDLFLLDEWGVNEK